MVFTNEKWLDSPRSSSVLDEGESQYSKSSSGSSSSFISNDVDEKKDRIMPNEESISFSGNIVKQKDVISLK